MLLCVAPRFSEQFSAMFSARTLAKPLTLDPVLSPVATTKTNTETLGRKLHKIHPKRTSGDCTYGNAQCPAIFRLYMHRVLNRFKNKRP